MIERKVHIARIVPFIVKPIIKVITGIRRCGKSTLLKQIVQVLENRNANHDQIISLQQRGTKNTIFKFVHNAPIKK